MLISKTGKPVAAGMPDIFVAGLPDGLLAAVRMRTILYPYVVGEFHRLFAQIFFSNF
jgi:hypothetical protein